MGGLGFMELLLILLIVGALGLAMFVGLAGDFRTSLGRGKARAPDFERRVLDELDVIRLRMDALTERLDKAGIKGGPDEGKLPPGRG